MELSHFSLTRMHVGNNWVLWMKKEQGLLLILYLNPHNEEISIAALVHAMLGKLRHQLAYFAGEKSAFALFLHPSADATYLSAVRKKIMGWMDLKSVTVWQFFCHCEWRISGWPLSWEILLSPSRCQGIPVLWGMGWNCSQNVWQS